MEVCFNEWGGGLLAACYYWLHVFVGCCCQSAACLQVSPAAEGRVAVNLQTVSSQPEGRNNAKRNLRPPKCNCRKLVFMGKERRGCKLKEMNGMGKGKALLLLWFKANLESFSCNHQHWHCCLCCSSKPGCPLKPLSAAGGVFPLNIPLLLSSAHTGISIENVFILNPAQGSGLELHDP